jgi:hypothetical protein
VTEYGFHQLVSQKSANQLSFLNLKLRKGRRQKESTGEEIGGRKEAVKWKSGEPPNGGHSVLRFHYPMKFTKESRDAVFGVFLMYE